MLRKQKDLDAAAAKARKPGDLYLAIIYLTLRVGRGKGCFIQCHSKMTQKCSVFGSVV